MRPVSDGRQRLQIRRRSAQRDDNNIQPSASGRSPDQAPSERPSDSVASPSVHICAQGARCACGSTNKRKFLPIAMCMQANPQFNVRLKAAVLKAINAHIYGRTCNVFRGNLYSNRTSVHRDLAHLCMTVCRLRACGRRPPQLESTSMSTELRKFRHMKHNPQGIVRVIAAALPISLPAGPCVIMNRLALVCASA